MLRFSTNIHVTRHYVSQILFLSACTSANQSFFDEIMLKQVTPEKAINIIWLSVAFTFCWPLSANSSKTQILGYKIMQICAIVNVCLLLLPSIYLIYLCSDDMEVISRNVSQLICEVQCIIQTVICFCKHDTLQVSS